MRYSIISSTLEQVKAAGGTDIKEAPNTKIIFAELSTEQADHLKAQGCLVSVVGSVKAHIMPPPFIAAIPTYTPGQIVEFSGLEQLRQITRPMLYGGAMNVAIIGSGIRETHQKINGHVIYRKNFTADPMRDGLNHDTGVASIIIAVASRCNLLNLKVLNDAGEGTEEEVILAIDECITLRNTNPRMAPSVINLSLGAPDDGNPNNILRIACRTAIDVGIWVIASAGNGGPNPYSITSPASERYVCAVGSLSVEPFAVSSFSSRGPTLGGLIKPDTAFFGEDISVASSADDTATIAKSGTSFSTPFVSGLALLYQEAMIKYQGVEFLEDLPGPDYPEITALVSVADMLDKYIGEVCVKPQGSLSGKDNDYGYGLVWGLSVKKLFAAPAMDISTILQPIMGIFMLSFLGMIIAPISKKRK